MDEIFNCDIPLLYGQNNILRNQSVLPPKSHALKTQGEVEVQS
jgi:hypothetical protein